MLQQKLNTPFQPVWIAKLMGFDFEIEYKTDSANVAADALSRKNGVELFPLKLDNAKEGLLYLIKQYWKADPVLQKLIIELQIAATNHPKFTWVNEELSRKGKLVVGNDPELKLFIFKWLQDSFVGGHFGRDVTAARIKSLFYWKGMSKGSSIMYDIVMRVREISLNQCPLLIYITFAYPSSNFG